RREDIAERMSMAFVNEAARCLEEGILRSARDGDIGAVFGLGYPPFRGGPFWTIDQMGAETVVDKLIVLAAKHGDRFEPAQILRDYAAEGKTFRS
ncbi:MAG: 3-hydroxyacyl-CoA dehydrogenase family protein, partial [Actinomycetia bacterium]|nr:3-hydroxyacyl-CoA dehydrogenase family protein [Actinomycetes bacterium]